MTEHKGPDMRAAEYVLGTLSAEEVASFERALTDNAALQAEVAYWEEQLGQIGLGLTPVEPPTETWTAIQARLNASVAAGTSRPEPTPSPRHSNRIWQGLAIAASVACIVLAGFLYQAMTRPVPGAAPTFTGMFYDKPSDTGWVVTASSKTGDMSIVAMGDYSVPKGKELRLWVIPEGHTPIASGIVPSHGHKSWSMKPDVMDEISQPGTILAVTLEPADQPVSGGAKGPLMWKSKVHQSTG